MVQNFELSGNTHILFIIILHPFVGYSFIGLKQWIWWYYAKTTVSVEHEI